MTASRPRRPATRRLLGLAGLWSILLLPGLAQERSDAAREWGIPLIDTFNVRDYGEHNQTWVAVRDRAGRLYVGNRDLVLVFDGRTWESIPTGGLFVRALAVDATDRIWVGGVGEIGFLEVNDTGGRDYVSLREHLPPDDRGTLIIVEAEALSHGVYFGSAKGVLRWHEGELTTYYDGPSYLWKIGDVLFTQGPRRPIRSFDGTTWQTVLQDSEILDEFIYTGLPRPDGSQLLITRSRGLYRLHQGIAEPWPAAINATLRQWPNVGADRIGTDVVGIRIPGRTTLLLNADGELLHDLNADNRSLPVSTSLGFDRDEAGDIWILLSSGLARVAWPSPITHFDERRGLGTETVKSITRFAGRLYVGTNGGLQVLQPQDPGAVPPQPARFMPVAGPRNETWALAVAGADLLVGSRAGLGRVDAGGTYHALDHTLGTVTAVVVPQGDPNLAWVGTNGGLHRYRHGPEGWRHLDQAAGVAGLVRALVEDRDRTIWASVDGRGFFRLIPTTESAAPTVEAYPGGHGLASAHLRGLAGLAKRGDEAVFLDQDRVYRFNAEVRRFEVILDPRESLPDPIASLPTLGTGQAGSNWVRTLREDPEAGPWKGRVFWRVTAAGDWQALPFAVADRVGENPTVFEEGNQTSSVLWIGGSEGLVRVELPGALLQPRPFRTQVRRVVDQAGVAIPLSPADELELPFDRQRLSFTFATDRVDDRQMRYQTRLEGTKEDWSPPSPVATFELNRLDAGRHILAVRARDVDGRLGAPARFSFTVLAPWWNHPWLQATLWLAFGGLAYWAVRRRLRTVQRRNVELSRLVDQRTAELRENETRLIEARDAADAANQAKSDFLANMSHELRTPLNAILGFTQILDRETGLSAKGRGQLATVSRNGRHLLSLINEVLDLSKIEANKLTLHPIPCSVPRLVSQLTEIFEPRATAKGLRFRVQLAADAATRILIDEPKLRQVLINLLANAVKFTREGEVVLAVSGRADRLAFEVRDTGIGIPAADQAAVFEPFQRLPIDPTVPGVDHQGTGLGLPISQRIVQLMGGTIRLTSQPGRGSRFHFELAAPPAPPEVRPPPARRITGYQGPRRHALIVDDVDTNRTILAELLNHLGFTTAEAATGEAALAAHAARPADLALLDLRLPDISGAEVAHRLSAGPGPRPRLVAVSASVFDIDVDQADRVGCDAFVPKPVDEAVLLETIAAQLQLEWITAEIESDGPVADTDALPLPAAAVIEPLLTLVRLGDIAALRDHLQNLPAAAIDPRTVRHLDHLAASFATSALRSWLTNALAEQRQSPP